MTETIEMSLHDQHKAGLLTDDEWVEAKMRENQAGVNRPDENDRPLSEFMTPEERRQSAIWLRKARTRMTRVIKALEAFDGDVYMRDIDLDVEFMHLGAGEVKDALERWHADEDRRAEEWMEQQVVYQQTAEWEDKERKHLRGVLACLRQFDRGEQEG